MGSHEPGIHNQKSQGRYSLHTFGLPRIRRNTAGHSRPTPPFGGSGREPRLSRCSSCSETGASGMCEPQSAENKNFPARQAPCAEEDGYPLLRQDPSGIPAPKGPEDGGPLLRLDPTSGPCLHGRCAEGPREARRRSGNQAQRGGKVPVEFAPQFCGGEPCL